MLAPLIRGGEFRDEKRNGEIVKWRKSGEE